MFATIFALSVFTIAIIGIGIAKRPKTENEFLIKDRKVGVWEFAAATFTLVGGGEFITLTALSYLFGFWSITYFLGGHHWIFSINTYATDNSQRRS